MQEVLSDRAPSLGTMRASVVIVALALASVMLAGCLGAPPPSSAPAPVVEPPAQMPAPATLALQGCRGSLHVWMLPLDQLRSQVPVGYEVEDYQRDGVATGLGRLLFYYVGCGGDAAGALRTQAHGAAPLVGLLGIKLRPPAASTGAADAPGLPADAVPVYAVQVYAQQHDLEVALRATPFPFLAAEHQDSLDVVPVVDLPSYAASLRAEDGSSFAAEVRATPPAAEPYARLVRAYYETDATTGVLDLNITSSLWEGVGSYEASPDSAIVRVIGDALPVVDHHILVEMAVTVTAWTEATAEHGHASRGTLAASARQVAGAVV